MLVTHLSKCSTCPAALSGACKSSNPARSVLSGVRSLRTTSTVALAETVNQPSIELPTSPPPPSEGARLVRRDKREGDISATFNTFSGRKANPLPARYGQLKRDLVRGNEERLQRSWDELIERLKVKTEEVATKRENVSTARLASAQLLPSEVDSRSAVRGAVLTSKIIPTANFADIQNGTVPDAARAALRDTGVMVVRNVLPRWETESLLADVRAYFAANPFKGFPQDQKDKVVYESYWSRSQLRARSHPNMLATQVWMMSHFKAAPGQRVDLSTPLTYADRVQIRPPGDTKFALSPHVDAGGIERWEDPAYSNAYRHIFAGRWQDYDPWDMTGRIEANMNMYNASGGGSVFRAFQGWLGLTTHGPNEGTLVVHPILKESTAYWLLRPFFKPTVKGSLNGWKLNLDEDKDGNIIFPGVTPGSAQEHSPENHPHLMLEETMVPYPTVDPGDTVYWSVDTIHGTEANNTGTQDACVFYIGATPLTDGNAQYLAQQRDAFLAGIPPPDFPGGAGERYFTARGMVNDITGKQGKQSMGIDPLPLLKDGSVVDSVRREANKLLGFN